MSDVNKQLLDAAKLVLQQAENNLAAVNLHILEKLTKAIAAAEQAKTVTLEQLVANLKAGDDGDAIGAAMDQACADMELGRRIREQAQQSEPRCACGDSFTSDAMCANCLAAKQLAEPVAFEVESKKFEELAIEHGLNMAQHPLHYLFLNSHTDLARKFWREAIQFASAQYAQPPAVADRDAIRRIFMAHGFTIKEGQTDLKPYVYEAAEALLRELSPAVANTGCKFPLCQNEQYQKDLAEHLHRELYAGAPAVAVPSRMSYKNATQEFADGYNACIDDMIAAQKGGK